MTDQQELQINEFLVQVFNKILAWEDQALAREGAQDLSIKELHVLEAVHTLAIQGRSTMTNVAESLSIRVSSLTTAVNTLVRKGYLRREGEPEDRRVIRIFLTETGVEADKRHSQFHVHMVRSLSERLTTEELDILVQSLTRLNGFFHTVADRRKADAVE